jgi:ABC-type uncharacterized transport system substrate-binding protein
MGTMSGTATATIAVLLSLSVPAFSHPHVFAEARLEVVIDGGRQVQALRHVWRFDDLFSSTVLVEFDQNQDLQLDHDELREVASVVHESLAEFNYFQLVTLNGRDVDLEPPEKLIADYVDNQLVILFETRPKETLVLSGRVDFGVYDPTFYTAIDFVEDEYMVVENLPRDCSRDVIRPDPEEAIAQNQQTLTEAFFNEPTGIDLSKIFATKLEITCSANG